MITFFTTCRPFNHPRFGLIQKNAMESWTYLNPKPEVLVMGKDQGTKEICQRFGFTHIDYVRLDEDKTRISQVGAPYMNSMIEIADEIAQNDIMLLICSDNVLFQDVIEAAKSLKNNMPDGFMAVVRRYNSAMPNRINFKDPQWREKAKENTKFCSIHACDFFMYPKGYFNKEVPDFVIGRGWCDNFLCWYAKKRNQLVNITSAVYTVHQNHGHEHILEKKEGEWWFEEKGHIKNKKISAGRESNVSLADWKMNADFSISKA